MTWISGKQLQNGRYTIQRVLAHGRVGITYLAIERNGDSVVIKTPNDEALSKPDADRLQQSFVKEAVKLAKCRHPHIVKAEEPFQEDGMWCIAMEYVDGTNLAERAQRILPEADALNYIQQIGQALIEVHSNNLLHRDVKPQNIMIRAGRPEAVLIDFGLAREFDHDLTLTRSEEITEGFAPIELYSRNAERGAFTDVYSLAATLYVLLTGQNPVSAKERKHSHVPLPRPKDLNNQISDRVNRAIMAGMELEADQRPQSIQAWLDLLGMSTVTTTATPSTSPNPPAREQQNSTLFWTAVAAIGTLLAGLAAFMTFFKPSPTPSPGAPSTPTSPPSVQVKPSSSSSPNP
ncbi:serine/threonine protein kinase [Oculatella sp. FACHB-28]|uniref:serine/threonine protein kinase n=1 Tax=Oculatella sp. FACHB-28 TaxID=2692845 RepID=UPI0016825EBC|nr:serine/threonine-protein kinase [Oculatella sp. FACHB-28]MBD2056596.1 serine/threonine protein kinase [Oculatella sp. FACHB-28]